MVGAADCVLFVVYGHADGGNSVATRGQSRLSPIQTDTYLLTNTNRAIAYWLFFCAAMVLLIVVIGGVTRLTESGLSITEWNPVSGVIPPLNDADWQAEFAKYQTTTEYQQLNRGMTLDEFRTIFFWEYLHRLWGRLVGAVFAIPFFYFLLRGVLEKSLRDRLWLILILIALQGALGWFMVQSGLSGRTDVSQYRLAAHLSLALFIYALMIWTALDVALSESRDSVSPFLLSTTGPLVRSRLVFVVVMICVTIVSGAFVAGLNAGRIYNTFPLMGGYLVPPSYLQLEPWYLNLFENAVAVQFNHRVMAIATFCVVVWFWFWSRRFELPRMQRLGINWLAVIAVCQLSLGITTLLSGAPVSLAAAHQTFAVLLLTAGVVTLRMDR